MELNILNALLTIPLRIEQQSGQYKLLSDHSRLLSIREGLYNRDFVTFYCHIETRHILATTNESPSILFMKRPLCTRLDCLRLSVQVTVKDKQAQQKKGHDVHTKQRHLQIGSSVLAKNFNSMPTWLPGIITACLSPLTYSIQLKDGRIWERYIDHIQQNDVSEEQNTVPEDVEPEDWSYSIPVQDECDTSKSDTITDTVPNRYPVQIRRAPQRLIEQTDI